MRTKTVKVNDKFQKGYKYELTEPVGRNFHPDFKPELTPKQMLALGVFGGKYMTDCKKEFPKDWFTRAKLSPEHHDDTLNFFHKHAPTPNAKTKNNFKEPHPIGAKCNVRDRSPMHLVWGHASQPLKVWIEKGWINEEHDPRGWFQWYCRYYMGRRLLGEDERQIKRWIAIRRHISQIKKNCPRKTSSRGKRSPDLTCRPTQRQAVLHWAYDSRKI